MADISLSADVDTSGAAAGMASIENQVKKTANSIGSYLSGAFSAGAILAEIDKITAAAETIHREAARFGIDAEQLQVVTNAAKQLGLDIGTVARSMNLLEINAQKALDPTTKQALAMEHLGISAKAFAALNPEQQFFALADAYKNSAQDGQAYADVAELIGRRNTEMVPLLAKGSQAIIDQGKAFNVMSNEEIESLHALKVEEEKTFAALDGLLARGIVSWSRYFSSVKDLITGKGGGGALATTALSVLVPGSAFMAPFFTSGSGLMPGPSPTPTSTPTAGGAGGGAPVGITDLAGGGIGGGRGSAIEEATLARSLNLSDRLNDLLQQREDLQQQLNVAMQAGDTKAATQYQLQTQIEKIDQQVLPLKQQIALEEQKGVDAADRQIQKSQNRQAIDQLDLQISDLKNKGNEYDAFLLEQQRAALQINLDFDEKIQAALDKANEARAKGLEQTAQENELLAQQLDTERQAALAIQAQADAQQRQRIAQGPNPLTINALAQNNLRLGATSDVYAQAVAASRGIQPGTPEYDRLLQQITAQDQLRLLQGKNLSGADQTARDQLVRWFANQQQQKATGAADTAHQQEINFWQAIAQGQQPGSSNPYNSIFGIPNLQTGQFNIPGATTTPNPATDTLKSQLAVQQKQLDSLTQIQKNTEIVHV